MRLLDTRFSGVAKGVGTAKILGRIHSAQMRLSQNFFLTCSFIVVEGKGSELLFGLDMLKKHRACIDLRKNALTFDDCDIPFLAEHELPEKQRRIEVHGSSEEDDLPDATTKTIIPQATAPPTTNAQASSSSAASASNTQQQQAQAQQQQINSPSVTQGTVFLISMRDKCHVYIILIYVYFIKLPLLILKKILNYLLIWVLVVR